jgi:PEP-CTERM motif
MRIKNYYLVALTVTMLLLGTGMASASITMYYNGPQGNNSGGEYTYPYQFAINGQGNYALLCDSFYNESNPGEQWNANGLLVTSLNSLNVGNLESPGAGVTGYLEGSYLFLEEVTAFTNGNSDPKGLYNWAIWDLFTGKDVSGANLGGADEAQVQSYLAGALSAGPGLSPSDFPGVVIYTPTDTSPNGPQEFFGYDTPGGQTPEPSSLALLGSGVIGLAVVLRRKVGV